MNYYNYNTDISMPRKYKGASVNGTSKKYLTWHYFMIVKYVTLLRKGEQGFG